MHPKGATALPMFSPEASSFIVFALFLVQTSQILPVEVDTDPVITEQFCNITV
jgi:hypothetical protein